MNNLAHLFWGSVGISLITFGGGSQALLEELAVRSTGWLTYAEFSAILAFGYSTPGPAVFGTTSFIGYRLAGLFGAFVGAVGIFIAPWLLALLANKYAGHFSETEEMKRFGQGVGLAAAGVLAVVALTIGSQSSYGLWALLIGAASCALSLRRVNPLLIILTGLLVGIAFK